MKAQIENRAAGLDCLLRGQAPNQNELLDEITVGLDSLTGFLNEQYLQTYIPAGGSKIKCVTGRPGCGKTHFAQVMLKEAEAAGFLTVSFSAKRCGFTIFGKSTWKSSVSAILSGCFQAVQIRLFGKWAIIPTPFKRDKT